MTRLLLLLAIVVVIALVVRKLAVAMRKPAAEQPDAAQPSKEAEAKLVRCVECGAFVPKGDTVPVANGFRCAGGCQPR